jgi:hypothetical protein
MNLLSGSLGRREVQGHGFTWERELCCNVYRATEEELKSNSYTSKMDLPSHLNRLDGCDISIKTTCSANTVCMADCLRIYDAVRSDKPFHMTVIQYTQDESIKRIVSITEVDLTSAVDALFGTVTREQIEELDQCVKSVPQKRKPTPEEHARMYALRDRLQQNSRAMYFNIKCNSTQSRLQCSFNRFQTFLESYPRRIVSQSKNNEFRGGIITMEIPSTRRVFKKSPEQSDLELH